MRQIITIGIVVWMMSGIAGCIHAYILHDVHLSGRVSASSPPDESIRVKIALVPKDGSFDHIDAGEHAWVKEKPLDADGRFSVSHKHWYPASLVPIISALLPPRPPVPSYALWFSNADGELYIVSFRRRRDLTYHVIDPGDGARIPLDLDEAVWQVVDGQLDQTLGESRVNLEFALQRPDEKRNR